MMGELAGGGEETGREITRPSGQLVDRVRLRVDNETAAELGIKSSTGPLFLSLSPFYSTATFS